MEISEHERLNQYGVLHCLKGICIKAALNAIHLYLMNFVYLMNLYKEPVFFIKWIRLPVL